MSKQMESITKAFQWDLARQVERLDFLLELLPRYAEWGYQELYLHLEDAVVYPSLPGVARPDAYSYKQFRRLVDSATKAGIRVVPIVNLLGHTQYLIKTPELRDLNELRDAKGGPLERGQICPLHPRTLEIADTLLRDMAPFCTAGKVHVGLDESFHLGKCPRCRTDVEQSGLAAHFAGYVNQLERLAAARGLRMGMWADMLALLPAAIPLLPRNVMAYDWYYYPFARLPRVELRNFAEVDLATPLQKRGIEYWGCPMNGAFRYEPMPVFGDRLANILSWWKRCQRVGAGGFLVTSWEANRLALELTTVVDAAAASLWLNPEIEAPQEMLAHGFARVFSETPVNLGRPAARRKTAFAPQRLRKKPFDVTEARRLARAALANDDCAFAGYYRWQINDRWDVSAERGGVEQFKQELSALEQTCRTAFARKSGAKSVPIAFKASLEFRLCLSRRDVFVRRAASGVFKLRRLLSDQLAASASERGEKIGESGKPRKRECLHRFQRFSVFSANARNLLRELRAEASAFAVEVRTGRAAARAMWRRSRDPQVRGPNELILDRDAQRLRKWTRWLSDVARKPELVWQATPVCGVWQLQFTVHNFAPALQKVVVEQQQPDGTWAALHELHTIEFRAFAARPRTTIQREFSVPIPAAAISNADRSETLKAERLKQEEYIPVSRSPDFPISFRLLRIAVRGIGQIAISRVELTDGVTRIWPLGLQRTARPILGRRTPQRVFPKIDSEWGSAAIGLRFELRCSRP